MERDGGSVHRPPILDGSNYDYWKPRMVAFLKYLDNKAWKDVLTGWEYPVVTKNGEAIADKKAEEQWTKEEDDLALGNSKALSAIFNGVDKYIFRLVNNCEVDKDAWDILKTTHEGTSRVKMSRL